MMDVGVNQVLLAGVLSDLTRTPWVAVVLVVVVVDCPDTILAADHPQHCFPVASYATDLCCEGIAMRQLLQ